MRSADLRSASRRIAFVRAGLLVLFAVLAGRAAHLSVVATRGVERGHRQTTATLELPATRGLIVDRSGVELAITLHAPSVYVIPPELEKNKKASSTLAAALQIDPARLARRLKNRQRYTFVARWVPEEIAEAVLALGLPGVGVVREPRRAYPAGALAASILGFANIDGTGVRGIEQQEDGWLRGSRLRTPVERDALGHLISHTVVQPLDATGGDVALTIDVSMQAEAEAALAAAIEHSGARGGCVITLDPHSGEILALAEAPSFNPNDFRKVPYAETRSRAFVDAIEPGSTFKAFLMAAALDEGTIRIDQQIDTGEGVLQLRGKRIRDHEAYGVLNPAGILRVSSNVGAVLVAQELGRQAHHRALQRFGFGTATGSGFPTESSGLLRAWKAWKPIDHATIAFGQGVSVTVVQLASAMAVLAGGGEWRQPHLVKARRKGTSGWEPVTDLASRPVVTKQSADAVLEMLESVVSSRGTARRAALKGVRVAGKTGTAQKFDVDLGRYSQTRYTAWFMGAAPADDPQLVVVALLDEPAGPQHGGGDVAAPLFARVTAGQLAHLGIITKPQPLPRLPRPTILAIDEKVSRDKVSDTDGVPAVSAQPPREPRDPKPARLAAHVPSIENDSAMAASIASNDSGTARVYRFESSAMTPDFYGVTIASARNMAERETLVLEIVGDGLAIGQDPSPGTVLVGNQKRVRVVFGTDS